MLHVEKDLGWELGELRPTGISGFDLQFFFPQSGLGWHSDCPIFSARCLVALIKPLHQLLFPFCGGKGEGARDPSRGGILRITAEDESGSPLALCSELAEPGEARDGAEEVGWLGGRTQNTTQTFLNRARGRLQQCASCENN